MPPDRASDQLAVFNSALHDCLEVIIINSSDPEMAWLQEILSIRLGGLGLQEACRSSAAAFVGSCNANHQLSKQLLPKGRQDNPSPTTDSLPLMPGEQPAQVLLQQLISGYVPNPNTDDQHHLQVPLDSNLWSTMKQEASLCNQAHINTISAQHVGAWLWALPNPKLSLAMHSKEFVITMWLRVDLANFPTPPEST